MAQTKLESKSEAPKQKRIQLSVWQSIISGSIAGAAEVGINHPLWAVKTLLQKGEPITLNPSILYRGIIPNATSMIPITALQVGFNRFFQQWLFRDQEQLPPSRKIIAAFAAGVASSLVSCPTEMIMTHQRKGFYTSAKQLVAHGGWQHLYTGLLATMLREGMFTTFFLGVTPVFKEKIHQRYPYDFASSLFAGILAGIGATFASQWADMLKTLQQSAESGKSMGLASTMRQLYSSKGVSGFFAGAIPRGTRVISAVTIMSWITEEMQRLLTRSEDNSGPSMKC